jgi:hypothetical protein
MNASFIHIGYRGLWCALLVFVVMNIGCIYGRPATARVWTIPEVKEWSTKWGATSTWKGWILYQGTDSLHHRYIGRWMDEWTWFRIDRSDLHVDDVRLYNTSSSAPMGYYYVDPNQGFMRVQEYAPRN